jgi:3-dehydroquinate synthetase
MIIAMKISVFLGHLSQNKYQRVRNLLTLIGLPLESELGINDYLKIIQFDKKRNKNQINLILLKDIGQPFIYSIEYTHLHSIINDISKNKLPNND